MYCSACGQPMDASQPICQKCGRQSAPIASYAPVSYPRNRVHRHMHAMAILWIAYSLWILLHWIHCGRISRRSLHELGPHEPWF